MPGIDGKYPGGDWDITNLAGEEPSGIRKGVFAQYPAMTPKYHTGNNNTSLQYMARLLVPMSAQGYQNFINSVPGGPARSIARSLVVAQNNRGSFISAFGYIDFLLQQVQEGFQEKYEAVDVLSDNYVSYFYGQQPPIFSYSGTLLNTYQDDWRTAFTVMYQELLRGTKMARRKAVVTLAYDDVMVTGVLLNMSQTLTADMEMAVPFTFQLLVKQHDVYTRSGAPLNGPTPLWGYPFKITPGSFVSPVVTPTSVSTYNAPTAIFTITPRQAAPADPTPPSKITYVGNVVTAGEELHEKAIADKYSDNPQKFPEPVSEVKEFSATAVKETTTKTYNEKVKDEIAFSFPPSTGES